MTDYVGNITTRDGSYTIGGENFDGKWVQEQITVYDGFPSYDSTYTYDLSTYLPDDDCVYEILVDGYGYTGTNDGNNFQIKVNNGSSATHDSACLVARAISRKQGEMVESSSNAVIPIRPTDKKVSIFFNGNFKQSVNKSSVRIYGYRRVAKNGSGNDLISNFEVLNNGVQTNLPIGGDTFTGKWISTNSAVLFGTNYTAGTTYAINLKTSNILPNDNYQYEVLFWLAAPTGGTAGDWVMIKCSSNLMSDGIHVLAAKTQTNNINKRTQIAIMPVGSDGIIYFRVDAATNSTEPLYIASTAYRRIGTND